MIKDGILLLKTLLLSTSQINIYRHTTDQKKKKKVVVSFIGLICLYTMLMAYSISMCIGYGAYGLIDGTPVMCALVITAWAFLFTFLKTNGYLFNFREYDMLMALPFDTETVAACKFLYMYVKSLPWYLSVSIAMMAGYGYYARPSAVVYPIWLILTLFVPVIPMLAASFLGFIVARISSGFKKNNIIQTVLTFAFVIFCFSLRYIIDALFENGKAEDTFEQISVATGSAARIYLPAKWFSDAVLKPDIVGMLLLIAVSTALFAVLFRIVGRSYRNINSALKSHAAARNFKMTGQKKHSVVQTIAYKEFRRMTGSTNYMVNGALGMILAALLGIVTLIMGFDKIVAMVTQNAPFDAAILQPTIPFIVYFCVGMMATTACSPSLEGKNYWIVQSLPISKKTLYQGKMTFNMYLSVPFMTFAIVCMCISAKVPVSETLIYIVLGFMLCCFSTAWGCVCGIKHMRLDWENEMEVIKQGTAVAIYLFPNMIATMGLCVLMTVLGRHVDHVLLALILIVITGVLAALSYMRAMALAERT